MTDDELRAQLRQWSTNDRTPADLKTMQAATITDVATSDQNQDEPFAHTDAYDLARPLGDPGHRHRWIAAAAAAVVLIAGAIGIATLANSRYDQPTPIETANGAHTDHRPALASQPLLDLPPAALAATPTVPTGWQRVDAGLLGLSAPSPFVSRSPYDGDCRQASSLIDIEPTGAWYDPSNTGCTSQPETVVVIMTMPDPCTNCAPLPTVNGLEMYDAGSSSDGLVHIRIPQLQADLAHSPNWDPRILDTITPSPTALALADGTLADTATWQVVEHGDVSALAPSDWPTTVIGQDDAVPSACGQPLFSGPAKVFVGEGNDLRHCVYSGPNYAKRTPANGLWLAAYPGNDALTQRSYQVLLDGHPAVGSLTIGPDSVSLKVSDGPLLQVTVGLGNDLTIARTILRTLRIGPHQPATTPEPTSTGTSTSATSGLSEPAPSSTVPTDLDQLRASLVLPSSIELAEAEVVSGPITNADDFIWIGRGSDDRVTAGMPVVVGSGLVGQVVDVAPRKSKVRLITARDFPVGVTVQGVTGVGIAHGLGDPQKMSADGFPITTDLHDGQLLETAGGRGSPYPAGIPVGTLEHVTDDNSQMQKTADVKLVPTVDDLTYVVVVLYQPG